MWRVKFSRLYNFAKAQHNKSLDRSHRRELLIELIRFYHGACERAVARLTRPFGGRRGNMTTLQLHLFNGLYLIIFVAVAFVTRATVRRIGGALAGGAVAGGLALGLLAVGEDAKWWHMAINWEPYFLTLLWLDFALGAFIFLITWRIARRFGWRGLVAVGVLFAVLGPVRDYQYLRRFPEWGVYAPGPAPILAISATYVLLLVVGHWVMRLVAGPAGNDPLARRRWKNA